MSDPFRQEDQEWPIRPESLPTPKEVKVRNKSRRERKKNLYIVATCLFLYTIAPGVAKNTHRIILDRLLHGDRKASVSDYESLESTLKAMQPYEKENKEFRKKWENLKDKINVHNPSIIDRIRVSNFLKDPRGIITARNGVAIFSEDTVVFYKDYDGDSIVDVYHRIDGKTRKILIEKSLWFEGVTAYLPDFPKEARFMERPFQHRIDRDYHQARKEGIYLPCIVLD